MKKLLILITIGILVGVGWWLISPLFINKVVEEDFPVSQQQIKTEIKELTTEMTAEQVQEEMNKIMESHGISQEKIDSMTEEEKIEMEEKIVDEFANLQDKLMEEDFAWGDINFGDAHPLSFKEGQFQDADNFHKGSGKAAIVYRVDGSLILRFDDVSFTNGPDLRVYLTKEANPTKDDVKNGLEIAELKGNKGSHNYFFPEDFNPLDYNAVVIYCKPFNVIFSTATLDATMYTDNLRHLYE